MFSLMEYVISVASLVGRIGIPTAVVKYVAEYKEDKEKLNILVPSSSLE